MYGLLVRTFDSIAEICAVWTAPVRNVERHLRQNPPFSQLFLCLSRAWLGKLIAFSILYKWRQKGVFRTIIRSCRSIASRMLSRYSTCVSRLQKILCCGKLSAFVPSVKILLSVSTVPTTACENASVISMSCGSSMKVLLHTSAEKRL
jgi:hypothetical protein